MRSLDRRSMYSIFAPLDPDERLPRELILERRPALFWGVPVGRRQIAALLWGPALLATLAIVSWWHASPAATLAAVGLLVLAFVALAFRRSR